MNRVPWSSDAPYQQAQEPGRENARLKKLVEGRTLDFSILKEVPGENDPPDLCQPCEKFQLGVGGCSCAEAETG